MSDNVIVKEKLTLMKRAGDSLVGLGRRVGGMFGIRKADVSFASGTNMSPNPKPKDMTKEQLVSIIERKKREKAATDSHEDKIFPFMKSGGTEDGFTYNKVQPTNTESPYNQRLTPFEANQKFKEGLKQPLMKRSG